MSSRFTPRDAKILGQRPHDETQTQTASLPGSLTVGALGHLFYVTSVSGTVDYGCGTVGTTGASSTVVTQRDQAGNCLWSTALPAGASVGFDATEEVAVGLSLSGTIELGGALTSQGTSDLAIAKLDATTGTFLWSTSFGAPGASVAFVSSVGGTTTGGLAVVGSLSGGVDFGCGTVTSTSVASTLLARFDENGAVLYSEVASAYEPPVVDGLGGFTSAVVVTQGHGMPQGGFGDNGTCPAGGVAIATRIGP